MGLRDAVYAGQLIDPIKSQPVCGSFDLSLISSKLLCSKNVSSVIKNNWDPKYILQKTYKMDIKFSKIIYNANL